MNPFSRTVKQSAWFRYGVAVIITLIALAVRLWLNELLGRHSAFASFTFAVMLSAAIGGWGPGAVATVLGALAASYFWRDPRMSLAAERTAEAIQFSVFLVVGTGTNFFAWSIKRAQLKEAHSRHEAEAANRAKDQFLAMLSHELRTPLSAILLSASAMETDGSIPEELRGEISMIRRNIDLEARLIDDLLDVTRISKGKLQMRIRPVDAHKVLARAADTVRHEAENKGICLALHLDAKEHNVNADPARLQQVYWNLIRNSAKFTDRGGRIDVRTHNNPEGDFIVQVTDTGIGIAPELLPKIFNAFEQGGDGTTRRFGGLGLGLSISKGLVDLHGGKLTAKSDGLGKGATMVVDLPVTTDRETEATAEKPSEINANARILVVEDDESTTKVLSRLLGKRGYQVRTAATLAETRHVASGGEFDLLLSDLSLPDGSGLELVRELSKHRHFKSIALSGYGTDSDIQASMEAGFSLHLTKPIDIDSLDSAIRKLCA